MSSYRYCQKHVAKKPVREEIAEPPETVENVNTNEFLEHIKEGGYVVDEEFWHEEAPEDTNNEVITERPPWVLDDPPEKAEQEGRHTHPCACDLSIQQRRKIEKHLREEYEKQFRFEKRIREIEEELARIAEEEAERERELQEQEELFEDQYDLVGKKKKRKKRSARRASMVSLGVKQVINWKKQPRIEVKVTKTTHLRNMYSAYCGSVAYCLSPTKPIDIHAKPLIQVRTTKAARLRETENRKRKQMLDENEDTRPIFQTAHGIF